MLPSSTVENYLKAIYLSQSGLPQGHHLVSMGQIASKVNVAPGTATTMIKALAEAGLVQYEPYSGVRLTPAGERLAALVLRRHRLIELFLVKVMGMSWAEVHDEAEQLEHVVSDRIVERIDEMLGRPKADPHGDPIPDPEGTLAEAPLQTLLACPLNTPVTVARISDQDAAFLRFIETNDLKPGQSVEVEARDPAADSVRIRAKDGRQVTIGTRAASKLLVQVLQLVVALLISVSNAGAQTAQSSARPFEIVDNSFLIEEAFNQEAGVVQNIFTFTRAGDATWDATFTQEWPVGSMTHQFSYTLSTSGTGTARGIGDTLINYRYQVLTETSGHPAFAPRLSLVVPSGSEHKRLGNGVVGLQVNLPFSKQFDDVYLHWNVGVTELPGVKTEPPADTRAAELGGRVRLTSPTVGASVIWRMKPMLNLMVETLAEFAESVEGPGSSRRETAVTLSPGFRGGWNIGDHQLIIGLAAPVTRSSGDTAVSAFGYFSYELPFRK